MVLGMLLVVLAVGIVWGAQAFQNASKWVSHTNQVRVHVEGVLVGLNEAESSHRGYLLSGDTSLRRQSLMAQGKALELSRQLPELVSDNPTQFERAKEMENLISQRFQVIENVAIIHQSEGQEAAHALWIKLRQGNKLPEKTRMLAENMLTEEHTLLEQRQQRAQETGLLLEVMALAGMSTAIALVFISGLSYRREGKVLDQASRSTQVANEKLALTLSDIEKEHSATQGLAGFAGLLQGCQSIAEIFQVSIHSIPNILPGTSGSFYLMRDSRDHAEVQSDWGNYWKDRPQSISPAQCWGLRQGRPFRSEPGKLCCQHRLCESDAELGFSTCIPMMVQGNEVGLVFIQHAAGWDKAAMGQALSEQLALAITNLRLRETLRTQSMRDPLTGLSNRRELDEQLPREISRSQTTGHPLGLLVLDIDHFKRFNDTFGHDAGDAVLREFAHLLRKHVRAEDVVARMGGEEFVVMLPGMHEVHAVELAERMRSSVEGMDVMHRGQSLGKLTTSIGVAQCPDHATTPEGLLAAADAALYLAKNHGRNRVCVSGGIPIANHRKTSIDRRS